VRPTVDTVGHCGHVCDWPAVLPVLEDGDRAGEAAELREGSGRPVRVVQSSRKPRAIRSRQRLPLEALGGALVAGGGWDDDDGWDDEGWFEIDCVDLVYPISIVNPEGDIISVESEDSLHEYIDQYYENCNSDNCGDFTLAYPLTVEYYSETNDQVQTLTINSEEELEELLDEYCYDDEGEDETCGEIVYPVTVEAPNGDQFTANSEEEVYTFMEEWYSNNCNTVECDDEFEVVYPITMEFENEQGEIIVLTIQSEEMLEEITEQYCGD